MGASDAGKGGDGGELLENLLLAEFAILTILSVLKKFICNKSTFCCSYKTVVFGLLAFDSVTLICWLIIPFLGPSSWLARLQEVLVIAVVLAAVATGWYSVLKENTTIMLVYQICLIVRLLYLIAQIPIWHFLDQEFTKLEKMILKLSLMPYIFIVLFFHTMANELRKELIKEHAKKKDSKPVPTSDPDEEMVEIVVNKQNGVEAKEANGNADVKES